MSVTVRSHLPGGTHATMTQLEPGAVSLADIASSKTDQGLSALLPDYCRLRGPIVVCLTDARNSHGSAVALSGKPHFTHNNRGSGSPMAELALGRTPRVFIYRLCEGCNNYIVTGRPPQSLCVKCAGRQSHTKRRRVSDEVDRTASQATAVMAQNQTDMTQNMTVLAQRVIETEDKVRMLQSVVRALQGHLGVHQRVHQNLTRLLDSFSKCLLYSNLFTRQTHWWSLK